MSSSKNISPPSSNHARFLPCDLARRALENNRSLVEAMARAKEKAAGLQVSESTPILKNENGQPSENVGVPAQDPYKFSDNPPLPNFSSLGTVPAGSTFNSQTTNNAPRVPTRCADLVPEEMSKKQLERQQTVANSWKRKSVIRKSPIARTKKVKTAKQLEEDAETKRAARHMVDVLFRELDEGKYRDIDEIKINIKQQPAEPMNPTNVSTVLPAAFRTNFTTIPVAPVQASSAPIGFPVQSQVTGTSSSTTFAPMMQIPVSMPVQSHAVGGLNPGPIPIHNLTWPHIPLLNKEPTWNNMPAQQLLAAQPQYLHQAFNPESFMPAIAISSQINQGLKQNFVYFDTLVNLLVARQAAQQQFNNPPTLPPIPLQQFNI